MMLVQMLIAARIDQLPPLVGVRQLMRLGLAGVAAHLNTIDPELATQFLDTTYGKADLKDKFLASCWGTLTSKMRRLLTETVIRSLTKCDFTPEEILCSEKPVTLYVQIPERRLFTLAPLVRLFYGTLLNEMIDIYDKRKGKGCKDVLFLIDEAGRTKIPALADLASTVIGRRMSLCMDFQSLSQMEIVYGKAGMQVLLDNMDTQLFYRPSDIRTANYLQERLGPRSAYAYSQTLRDGEETSVGKVERPIPLFASQDIMIMDNKNVFAFHQNNRPMELNRVDWRKIQSSRRGMEVSLEGKHRHLNRSRRL
jgi:type IV secretory pathway TraG/TraD family ATPase VirD4